LEKRQLYNETKKRRQQLIRNDFNWSQRMNVADLTPDQLMPPRTNQLFRSSQHALSALHLYHHHTGENLYFIIYDQTII
jgi:hypothetical protein